MFVASAQRTAAACPALYAICAAPALALAPTGILNGKKATCYPAMSDKLKNKEAAGQRVVVDGNCITSQGAGTAMEFSLKLVEVLYGCDGQN